MDSLLQTHLKMGIKSKENRGQNSKSWRLKISHSLQVTWNHHPWGVPEINVIFSQLPLMTVFWSLLDSFYIPNKIELQRILNRIEPVFQNWLAFTSLFSSGSKWALKFVALTTWLSYVILKKTSCYNLIYWNSNY